VTPDEKHRRSQLLLALSDEKTRAFYESHIGKESVVLMEKSKAGTPMHGFTDNYVRVELPYDLSLDNKLVRVRMGDFNEDGTSLKGEIIS
jgi:threonylcarbamoyladenosine tRNA methylthiotransferase MtaB